MKANYGILPTVEDENMSTLTENDKSILESISLSVVGNENEDLIHSESTRSNEESASVSKAKESELLITEETSTADRMKIITSQSIPVTCSFVISIATTFITQYFAGRFEFNG